LGPATEFRIVAVESFPQSREDLGTRFAAIGFGLDSGLKRGGSQLFDES
jgi:hypothetical protein